MEYVDGLDLAKMVKARGPLPVANASNYAHQAALGLQHAHEHGMVHRDIKPGNLMLARQGNRAVVKVLDFGLAKVTREVPADGALTHEGQMLGTPDFIAPEQISDARNADIRADIYSLGCSLYYLLTGGPPFQGTSLYDILQAHHSRDALPLNLARPEVPVELAALVGKMMAKEPERRFQTPAEVAKALTPFFKKGTVASVGVKPDISQVGQPEAERGRASAAPVPTRPGTEIAPAPAPAARKPSEPTRPGSILEGLIDLRQEDPLFDKMLDRVPPKTAPRLLERGRSAWTSAVETLSKLGPRAWWAAAGVLLLALVAWMLVLRVKTSNGMIELVNLPEDAQVLVDGEEVAVTWPGGGKPALVTVTPGKHKILVKKDGLEISGDEVTVQAEGREKFTARLVPSAKRTRELRKDDGQAWINNSIGMTLKLIPAGEFSMGSPDDAIWAMKNEKPSHRVRITRPFYLGVYEVTQGQYEAVMGNNPSFFSAKGDGRAKVAGQPTDQNPVENVSWLDAVKFCNRLSEKQGLKPFYDVAGQTVRVPDWKGPGYRLPTEAEWEYACRGGSKTRYCFGDDPKELSSFAWLADNSGREVWDSLRFWTDCRGDWGKWGPELDRRGCRSHAVGQRCPNAFGLFDMYGNVWEWCWDGFSEGYFTQSPTDDPPGPSGAADRVIRGGSWCVTGPVRSALRSRVRPVYRDWNVGFRVARGESDTQTASINNKASAPANTAGSSGSPSTSAAESPSPTPVDKPSISPSTEPLETVTNTFGMALNLIPAGEFMMGSPNNDADAETDEKPQHNVRISPFYLGVNEVTQEQYRAVTGNNPSWFSSTGDGRGTVAGRSTDRLPVENVLWLDAVRFCNTLSQKEGRKPFYEIDGEKVQVPDWSGTGYRLPTEAEWEYACRTGRTTKYSFGDDPAELGQYAWYDGNSKINGNWCTHPVGQKRPNAFGLFDMHGNVWEWCWDGYNGAYYGRSPVDDPPGALGASHRVFRGGCWGIKPRYLRSAHRGWSVPAGRSGALGFRLALSQSGR